MGKKSLKALWRALLGGMLLTILLPGCAAAPEEPEFRIRLENATGETLESIHYEYALAEEPCGGGMVCNADGTELPEGDFIWFFFQPPDFPEGAELTDFSVTFYIVDKQGREIPAGTFRDVAVFGECRELRLEGNAREGYRLTEP